MRDRFDSWFNSDQSLPPSFEGNHFIYALSVFGLMTIFLLAAEWLWRSSWAMAEKPRPLRHPVTISRLVLVLILTSVVMRTTFDVVLTMAWPEMSQDYRLFVAQLDRLMDGLSAGPFFLAWLAALLGGAMIDWQLVRQPVPIDLWPTWRHLRRPAKIGGLVVLISLSVTYLR